MRVTDYYGVLVLLVYLAAAGALAAAALIGWGVWRLVEMLT